MRENTYRWAVNKGIIKWCKRCGRYHDAKIDCLKQERRQ